VISLYVDEDAMGGALVAALRAHGLDVLTSFEAETTQMSDEQQLSFAGDVERVIYTFNVNDFPRIHKAWLLAGHQHSGIIIGVQQQYSIGQQLRRLIRLATLVETDEWINRLEYLSNW
jgi:Domain of unknown function (DUF5615)